MTSPHTPLLYIETYGCQMNVNDSEVVASVMRGQGYALCSAAESADLVLINTCSIRENAEQRVWGRLAELRALKRKKPQLMLGVIGCMAERLKEKLLEQEQSVDIVVGPDAYRELPNLVSVARAGQKGVNVELSREETYAEIAPVRYDTNGVSAFVSIMRGCNNACSYCVVPYTRGAERSRDAQSILREVQALVSGGYREVTLLGQNVNSYRALAGDGKTEACTFAQLLESVALLSPQLRVRFSTSHPKDMSNEVLRVVARHPNICRSIHLPAQSGSTRVLELMNRKYTREEYLERIAAIRSMLPECSISTDLIAGFCTETEDDHRQTLSLMREVGYDFAFMFMYSERPNTKAARRLKDDVPEDVKLRRLNEIIALQSELSLKAKRPYVGKPVEVLAEGFSKKSKEQLFGRTSQNMVVVFPRGSHSVGDYLTLTPTRCTSATRRVND
ncbi:MAG: tRNA (N6-isopentenyl adenosine(37)-C2)-methylthiotransferase MiaB [Prevotellaceae bacterium]|jgi:tRNA-2-methylthio-N6-dimethylallyladenosine synthase|nr:tRNA (N6-isopentenyl adenosine(37)-C2)-methylthiotransferase MiaB [Prevotellaceae bacterium]